MSTKRIARAAVIAALYAVLTIVIAPLSYGPIQFRIAEALKPLVLFDPSFIMAFTIGNLLSNLTSPYVGPWELLFMPLANFIGASLCWKLRRWPCVGATVYAAVITLSVSVMLNFILGVPWWVLIWGVGIGEFVLIIGGTPLMIWIWSIIDK